MFLAVFSCTHTALACGRGRVSRPCVPQCTLSQSNGGGPAAAAQRRWLSGGGPAAVPGSASSASGDTCTCLPWMRGLPGHENLLGPCTPAWPRLSLLVACPLSPKRPYRERSPPQYPRPRGPTSSIDLVGNGIYTHSPRRRSHGCRRPAARTYRTGSPRRRSCTREGATISSQVIFGGEAWLYSGKSDDLVLWSRPPE